MTSKSALITVVLLAGLPPAIDVAGAETLSLRSDRIPSGGVTLATLTLSQAVTANTNFLVGVSGTNAAQAVDRIVIASGQSRAEFPVTAAPTASEQVADITITDPGTARVVARTRLTVTPPVLVTLALNKSETVGSTPGSTVTGTVTLEGIVPSPGLNVSLGQSCSNCGANHPPMVLPSTVRVPGGARTGSFSFDPPAVPSNKQFTVLASLGSEVKTAVLVDASLRPQSLSVSPSTIAGSKVSTLTIQLNAPAYSQFAMKITCTAALTVTLGASNKACPVPGNPRELLLEALPGQSSVSFQLRTQVTSPTLATIRVAAVATNGDAETTLTVAP